MELLMKSDVYYQKWTVIEIYKPKRLQLKLNL